MFVSLYKTYGLLGLFRLFLDIIVSRITFPGVRIIRRPFYIRGKGSIHFGDDFTSGVGLRVDLIDKNSSITIGNNVQINDYCHIGILGDLIIGDNTLIASKVFITDHNHGLFRDSCQLSSPAIAPIARPLEKSNVKIGANTWLGENVMVLPGVTIGDGVVIGSGSIVTKSVPDYCLAIGNPAKVIKKYNFDSCSWDSVQC